MIAGIPRVVLLCLTGTAATAQGPPQARLDHVPIAVRDLDAAAAHWRDALGFTIKPGRLHANSVLNAHVKLADGTSLELITASERRDDMAAGYLDFLRSGDGAAYLSLSGPAPADAVRRLDRLGAVFEHVTGPWYEWLTFERGSPYAYLFFGWLTGTVTDRPEHLRHANGATRLAAVWLAPQDDAPVRVLLEAFDAGPATSPVALPVGAATCHALAAGAICIAPATHSSAGRPIAGVTVAVADLDVSLRVVRVPVTKGVDERGRFARVAPEHANGLWLELLEPRRNDGAGAAPDSRPIL